MAGTSGDGITPESGVGGGIGVGVGGQPAQFAPTLKIRIAARINALMIITP